MSFLNRPRPPLAICFILCIATFIGSFLAGMVIVDSATRPPLTEAEKIRINCQSIHSEYDNVPVSQLTRKQTRLLNACESQGL